MAVPDGQEPMCIESEACEHDWHFWRCPKHDDFTHDGQEPNALGEQNLLPSALPAPDNGDELAALVDAEETVNTGKSLALAGWAWGAAESLHTYQYPGVTA